MDAFGALADPVRRGLLREIARGPVRVTDLAGQHLVSRPAVSRHLRVLSEAGVVRAESRGRERHYVLVASALAPVVEFLRALEPVGSGPLGAGALEALDTEVRRTVRERRTGRGREPAREETA